MTCAFAKAAPVLLLLLAQATTFKSISLNKDTPDHDRGPEHGSVVITNWCDYDLSYQSFGAWTTNTQASHEAQKIAVKAGQTVHEAYRETCYVPEDHKNNPQTCESLHKMEGQGVSMKFTSDVHNGTLQFEYALDEKPLAGEDYPRFNFDISLLDCAEIKDATGKMAEQYPALDAYKADGCGGFTGGLALWFDDNANCRPIYCDGVHYCDAIYNYDRTRPGESSLACQSEYYGDTHLEFCVSSGNESAYDHYMSWAAAVATVTNTADLNAPTGTGRTASDQGDVNNGDDENGDNATDGGDCDGDLCDTSCGRRHPAFLSSSMLIYVIAWILIAS